MINRNNYEEYFLLLADNELSPEEAAAVKHFAAQHPDLTEELDILLSCRLDAEPMPVFPKEKLLRTTLWNAKNTEPVHTQMLLLLDGELPATEKQQLQAQIAASTALQTEWNTLQQTKLVTEVIIHPNKKSLRRSDRSVRPLLWMRWAAAAAVVVGLGWLLWMQQEQASVMPSDTLTNVATPAQEVIENTQPQNATPSQPAIDNAQPAQIQQTAASTTAPIGDRNQQTTSQPAVNPAENNNTTSSTDLTLTSAPAETEPATALLSSTDVSLVPNETEMTVQVAHLSSKTVALPVLATNQKADVFTGSKNGLTDEEEEYVTVGGARINKHKMRGLFRNVTRTVTRSFSKSKLEPDVYATR